MLAPLPKILCAFPETARCSCMGSRGAGATASDRPMLRSEILCIAPGTTPGTTGAGPTTVALGVALARSEKRPPVFDGGATAGTLKRLGCRRPEPWGSSGAGATTRAALSGPFRCQRPVADNGIAGRAGWLATISGRAGPLILMSGGATSLGVCFGATRIVAGCTEAACPFARPRARPGLLPSAGKVGAGR
jgi:hypothetical protein